MGQEFEIVLSLGGVCQVAYQIEQYFGYRISSPFDWIVTPLSSVRKIFADDGESFGKSFCVKFNGSTAICNNYRVAHEHDFPRNDERLITITPELIANSRNKMLHKYSKFLSTLSLRPRTLFVRMGGHHDNAYPSPYVPEDRFTTSDDLNDLCLTIADKFPGLEFTIAFVSLERFDKLNLSAPIDPRIRLFSLTDDQSSHWHGRKESWLPIFESFRFNISPNQEISRQFVGERIHNEPLHG